MKITTRSTTWGIELKNDTVTEDIYNTSTDELKSHSINFIDVVKDLIQAMYYHQDVKDSVLIHLDNALNRLEEL